ncbi:hypothetical protein ARMSODRAFT_841649, partial [Armillaria solidipes]
LVDWLRMMYKRMTYVVKLGPHHSEAFKSIVGILAGDSSSPGLWNIYFSDFSPPPHADDVALGNQPMSHVEQADDIVLFSNSSEGLQAKLDILFDWCRKNSMTISHDKTKIWIAGPLPSPLPSFSVGGHALSCVSKHKYVGITLSSTDRSIFKEHYYIKASKARKSMNALFGAEHFVGTIPPKDGISVYMATVDPHITSACDVSIDIDSGLLAELERVQKTFIRRLLGIAKRLPVAMLFSETGMWPVKFHRLTLALRYWQYALSLPNDHLLSYAMKDAITLATNGKPSWMSDLRNALYRLRRP